MREVRIGDWLLEMHADTKNIRIVAPRTGPGIAWVTPDARSLQTRLLYALAKELIDTMGHERT